MNASSTPRETSGADHAPELRDMARVQTSVGQYAFVHVTAIRVTSGICPARSEPANSVNNAGGWRPRDIEGKQSIARDDEPVKDGATEHEHDPCPRPATNQRAA